LHIFQEKVVFDINLFLT